VANGSEILYEAFRLFLFPCRQNVLELINDQKEPSRCYSGSGLL